MEYLSAKDWFYIILIVFGAFVATGTTLWNYVEAKKKDHEASLLNNRLIEVQEELLSAQQKSMDAIIESDIVVKEKTERIIGLQKEINDLQSDHLKQIIGFGFAQVLLKVVDKNEPLLYVKSESDYVIKDLNIQVTNYDLLLKDHGGKPIDSLFFKEELYEKNSVRDQITSFSSNSHADLTYCLNLVNGVNRIFVRTFSPVTATFQYIIIIYDQQKNTYQFFNRIFEVNTKTFEFEFLKGTEDDVNDAYWESQFVFNKSFKFYQGK